MATSKAPMLLLALAVAVLLAAIPAEPAHSPPSAPAPAPDCQSVLTDKLASCFTFVLNGSTDKVPEKDCCKGLSTVMKEDLVCICQLAHDPNGGSSQAAALGIDANRVRLLPTACHTTVPADKCAKLGLPVTGAATASHAPASAPSAGGPGTGGAAGATGGIAPAPTSRAPRLSTAATSPIWALLVAIGLPVLAAAAASVRA